MCSVKFLILKQDTVTYPGGRKHFLHTLEVSGCFSCPLKVNVSLHFEFNTVKYRTIQAWHCQGPWGL